MNQFVYLDENVIGHLDDEDVAVWFDGLRRKDILPVISHNHLTEICMSPKFENYIVRLERLSPFFLSIQKSRELNSRDTVELVSMNVRDEILNHRDNVHLFERNYFHVLFPMLKITGGLKDIEASELLRDFVAALRATVNESLKDLGPISKLALSAYFMPKLWFAERSIRRTFSTVDFESDAKKALELRSKVASLGNISQIPVDQVAETIISLMAAEDQKALVKSYPKDFAKNCTDLSNTVMSFAFLLFSCGAITRTAKTFSGPSQNQFQRFRAQFIDCLHIGEAGHFDSFITCDSGAHRLAGAVYSYAGLQTLPLLLKIRSKL